MKKIGLGIDCYSRNQSNTLSLTNEKEYLFFKYYENTKLVLNLMFVHDLFFARKIYLGRTL